MPGRTMTIQNDTPGGQKPPTLAQLRALAKRKKYEVEYVPGGGEIELLPGVDDSRPFLLSRFYDSDSPELRDRTQAITALFAALSALPDKERAR